MATTEEANPLGLLLSAPSQNAIAKFFNACYRYRHAPEEAASSRHVAEFGLDPGAAAKLVHAGVELVKAVLYESSDVSSPEQIARILPRDLDKRLVSLISSLLFSGLPMWRESAVESRISLPKLVESDWRVDVVDSTASIDKAGVATLELDFTIRDIPVSTTSMPQERKVAVDLNHASLGAFVEGMRRVRDQLSAMN